MGSQEEGERLFPGPGQWGLWAGTESGARRIQHHRPPHTLANSSHAFPQGPLPAMPPETAWDRSTAAPSRLAARWPQQAGLAGSKQVGLSCGCGSWDWGPSLCPLGRPLLLADPEPAGPAPSCSLPPPGCC